jgi:ribosome biogenesis GTPase
VPALRELGFDDGFDAAFAPHARSGRQPARVARVDRGVVTVIGERGDARARMATAMLDHEPEELPAVGDWVALDPDSGEVVAVLPRRSAFVRADPRRGDQTVAANVDEIWIVHGLGRPPNPRRIERELVLAWGSGATPLVVLNKADLEADAAGAADAVRRVAPGVEVVAVSAGTGLGIDGLSARAAGRTSALIGPSGAGKSTIVNRVAGSEVRPTAAVRETDQKGRHTTTERQLVALPSGGWIIDTPGLRAVGLDHSGAGLDRAFPEVAQAAVACRFRDCAHTGEPGCAVDAAVESGAIDPLRLDSYRTLAAEVAARD